MSDHVTERDWAALNEIAEDAQAFDERHADIRKKLGLTDETLTTSTSEDSEDEPVWIDLKGQAPDEVNVPSVWVREQMHPYEVAAESILDRSGDIPLGGEVSIRGTRISGRNLARHISELLRTMAAGGDIYPFLYESKED